MLWPRGDLREVRYLAVGGGKRDWEAIADQIYSDESAARQAAFEHASRLLTIKSFAFS